MAFRRRNWKSYNDTYKKTGYRSTLEVRVGTDLKDRKVPFEYESFKIPYIVPERKTHYTPDFILKKQATIIEAKGEFDSGDRKKMKLLKKQYPDLRIVMLFTRPNQTIGTKSKTTYAKWCEDHGIEWGKSTPTQPVPKEWLSYKPTTKEKKALKEVMSK